MIKGPVPLSRLSSGDPRTRARYSRNIRARMVIVHSIKSPSVFTDICHGLRISRCRSTRSAPNDQFSGTRCILRVSMRERAPIQARTCLMPRGESWKLITGRGCRDECALSLSLFLSFSLLNLRYFSFSFVLFILCICWRNLFFRIYA